MPGTPVKIGPFTGGLHNSSGLGGFINDDELYAMDNLEVDIDDSLANRPAIQPFTTNVSGSSITKVIGIYSPVAGDDYLVTCQQAGGPVSLVRISTGQVVGSSPAFNSNVAVQYGNRCYVIALSGDALSVDKGGYFTIASFGATPVWTTLAAMPEGGGACIYLNRLWIVAGKNATGVDNSRLYWSKAFQPQTWVDVDAGNTTISDGDGQNLTDCIVNGSDLLLLKEHSMYRLAYTVKPQSAEVTKVSEVIGAPDVGCVASYNSSVIYVLHDNSVYEMVNYQLVRISQNLLMKYTTDAVLKIDCGMGLSVFRDRLFLRYGTTMYVYGLQTNTWARWVSIKRFKRLYTVSGNGLTQDTAYASTANTSLVAGDSQFYKIVDDRQVGVGTGETFTCSIRTKTFDFDLPHAYKVLFWWGLTIATTTNIITSVMVPKTEANPSWDEMGAQYTWDQANAAPILWDQSGTTINDAIIAPRLGAYSDKFYKLGEKKLRFRRAWWMISTDANINTMGDAAVRIFGITAFVLERETAVKRVS